jgi:hypothetical protein
MRLISISLLVLLVVSGCSRKTAGLADMEAAHRAAESFILHADADAVLLHIESEITDEEERAFRDYAKRWKSSKLRQHPTKTAVCTLSEFEESRKEFRKDWPAEMPYAPLKWSRPPEVVFVYHFEIKDEKEPVSGMYHVGAYRSKEVWYFSRQK